MEKTTEMYVKSNYIPVQDFICVILIPFYYSRHHLIQKGILHIHS